MRIAVLSRRPDLYSTQRLVKAGAERGHEMEVIDYLRCYMDITSHRPVVMLRGEKLHRFDAVIPRIAGIHTLYGTAVVRQFELMGVFAVNQSEAITRAHDKLHQLQLLAQSGVHLPVTGFANDISDISGLVDAVGGPPLLVKLLRGAQGKGVVLTETRKAAESVVSAFRQLNANILIQQYIKETRGADIRAFVIGRRVVAAMQRQASPGEFRANIHRGGTASEVELTPEERRIAVRAARRIGLRVAGVDMMRPADGPVVLEVNGSPGLQAIEAVTGLDVATLVIRYVERAASRVNGAKSRRTKAKRST